MISPLTALKLFWVRGLSVDCRIPRSEYWWDYLLINIRPVRSCATFE